MKLSLTSAGLILLAGMLVVLTGVFLHSSKAPVSNPIILAGLAIEFVGTIWLVLSLNQRRKKHRL